MSSGVRPTDRDLRVENLVVTFGGVKALSDVSFTVANQSLTAVIGPNGAGKTSLFNSMTGIYRPSSGSIWYRGEDLTRLSQHRIARLGIARTFQNLALFDGMSVLQNMMVGRYRHQRAGMLSSMFRTPAVAAEEAEHRERVEHLIDLLRIQTIRNVPVGDLAYGLRKRVELGRALAQEPELLLLDEPMAGMTVEEKEDMARFILDVRAELDTTLVLVEHDMGVVMDIASHVVVLDFGRLIASDVPSKVQREPAVIEAYLGTATSAGAPAPTERITASAREERP